MAEQGVNLSIKTQGLDAVGQALRRLQRRMADLRPVLDEIGASVHTSTRHRFEAGTGSDGQAWKPSIRARTEGGQTLRKDGHLMDSIVYRLGQGSVEIGTNLLYARIHQLGGRIAAKTSGGLRFRIGSRWVTRPFVDMPARPFLGLDDDDHAEILAIVADYARGAVA